MVDLTKFLQNLGPRITGIYVLEDGKTREILVGKDGILKILRSMDENAEYVIGERRGRVLEIRYRHQEMDFSYVLE